MNYIEAAKLLVAVVAENDEMENYSNEKREEADGTHRRVDSRGKKKKNVTDGKVFFRKKDYREWR